MMRVSTDAENSVSTVSIVCCCPQQYALRRSSHSCWDERINDSRVDDFDDTDAVSGSQQWTLKSIMLRTFVALPIVVKSLFCLI